MGSFSEKYGKIPGSYTNFPTYDAINILAQAITKAGTIDSDTLVNTFENGSFTGAGGVIEFNERHGIKISEDLVPFTFIQWQDGEVVTVWPKANATQEAVPPEWIK